ncbi:MAG TPA: MEDS domain-containing protein [Micromonosporaceae bacterium]
MATPTSVDDLAPGAHACLTFSDSEERLDILSAFVGNGLDQGQKVVCYTESIPPDVLPDELVDRGISLAEPLRTGQLQVHTGAEWMLTGGVFRAARAVERLRTELVAARDEGYSGLRISFDQCWATRPVAGVEQLLVFESQVNDLIASAGITAICQYDRAVFDPVTLAAVTQAHRAVVAATIYHEDPVLRICRQLRPPGIRVAGEIDYTRADVLSHALGEAVRLDRDVYVNLRQLRFIDVAAATVLLHAAMGLPVDRQMTVVCAEAVAKVIRLVNGSAVPSLRLVVIPGDF